MLILKHKTYPTKLRRSIKFENNCLMVEDQMTQLQQFTSIIVGANASYIYVPSSRWYEPENLNDSPFQVFEPSELQIQDACTTIKRQFQ